MGNSQEKQKKSKTDDLAVKFKVTKKEIAELKDMYRASCEGNSYLTRVQFQKVYGKLFPGDAVDFANIMFDMFDSDKNGYVDLREFIIGLLLSDSQNVDEKIQFAFKMYDRDRNGEISYDEVKTIAEANCKMYQTADSPSPDKIAKLLFHYMDKNNDQSISKQEFFEAARTKPEVMNLLFPKPPDEIGQEDYD